MWDVLYVVGTVVFYALLAGYVAACARLGRGSEAEETR